MHLIFLLFCQDGATVLVFTVAELSANALSPQ